MALPPIHRFCLGTSLAGLVNVETSLGAAPTVLSPATPILLTGGIRRVAWDSTVSYAGKVNADIAFDEPVRLSTLMTFIAATWGTGRSASLPLYAAWLDEDQHYSPFSVTLERPRVGDHYTVHVGGVYVDNLRIPGLDWRLLSRTLTDDATLTGEDRLVFVDTTAEAITLALPAAASVGAYTPFSVVCSVAGNDIIIDPDGSELIDGASTKTFSTLNQRVDLYSDGSNWFTFTP